MQMQGFMLVHLTGCQVSQLAFCFPTLKRSLSSATMLLLGYKSTSNLNFQFERQTLNRLRRRCTPLCDFSILSSSSLTTCLLRCKDSRQPNPHTGNSLMQTSHPQAKMHAEELFSSTNARTKAESDRACDTIMSRRAIPLT